MIGIYHTYYTWGDAGRHEVPDTRIYLITADGPNFVQTDDFGASFEVIQSRTYAFLFLEHQIFSIVVSIY
jgi:hypothetical protein